jgi:parallel beta-helix repeat protein
VQLRDSVITGSYWGLRGVYSKVEMRNCRIENNLLNGANLRDSTLNVSGSHISGNRKGLYLQSSKLTMENTQLTDNSEHGLYLENSEGLIKGNRISGNGRAGIRILDFSGEIVGNSLVNNGEYAVQNDGSTAAVAPGNWWGTVDVERISALIRDSRDRPGIGPVNAIAPLSREPAGLPEE